MKNPRTPRTVPEVPRSIKPRMAGSDPSLAQCRSSGELTASIPRTRSLAGMNVKLSR
jgi:hypothetical protein